MRTRLLVLPATGALLIGMAAPASATITVSFNYVDGDAASDSFGVSCSGGVLSATTTATTGSVCAGLRFVNVVPGGGTDSVDLSGVTAATFPSLSRVDTNIDDGAADVVTGSPLADYVIGDNLDTANGGSGSDSFHGVGTALGGLGDDVFVDAGKYVAGGPGDDRFVQVAPTNGIEGGEGHDTWEVDFGQVGGATEVDAVSFTMGPLDIVLQQPGLEVSVPVNGVEHVEMVLLRDARDTWDGSAVAATQNVRSLSGSDTLTGGGLSDVLVAGAGNDTLTGGGASDVLDAGVGDDTVQARDGAVDTVLCGDGTDSVVADATDVVTGCESVQLPAVAAPAPTPAPTPPAAVVPDTGAIAGKAKISKPTAATFRFASATAGATFECRVDKGSWKACASPFKVKTRKLALGRHTLSVRAVLAGVVDPTPSVRRFRLVR